ncbi:MAG: urease accessory protein UreD [Caldilineaceae bacterium]
MPTNHRVNGRLHLSFTRPALAANARLHVQLQSPPLRVVRAFPIDGHAVLTHLHNVSGGVLGGDHLSVCVDVQTGAHVQLTTTGATRVYRHRPGHADATQSTHLCVAAGGLLEYLPDPLIPYAGARYHQRTRIELADDAGLFYWEVLTPGREARQECFAYDLVTLQCDIMAQGRPLAVERVRLEPTQRALTSLMRLGLYRYSATFYICRVGVAAAVWQQLETKLATIALEQSEPDVILWGVSTLPVHGLSVRALSINSRAITTGLVRFWQVAKQELYGLAAIPPRKVY